MVAASPSSIWPVAWVARAQECRNPGGLYVWLKKVITFRAAEGLRRRDLLDQQCYSLDEPWARGEA
jgi:hypothetical protein